MNENALGAKTGRGIYSWPKERITEIQRAREENLLEWLKKDQQED